jgi:purine-binding chemotaxis protein CheW
MADEKAVDRMDVRHVVVFQIGGRACALRLGAVREILAMAELSRPPGLPALLLGFLNRSGRPLPVVRLAHLFDLEEPEPGLYTPLLIVESGARVLALLVECVTAVAETGGVIPLPLEDRATFCGCAESFVEIQGKTVPLLNADRILLEEERRRIAEFEAEEQRRLAALAEARP